MEEQTAAVVTYCNGKTRAIRASILSLVTIIFIGYIFMWFMKATNTYRHHFDPKIEAHTDSTFFGKQGSNLLVYAFPMLFISVLGCVYLHLGGLRYQGGNSWTRSRMRSLLSSWRRPLIIKYLGIVSWIEIFIFVMFIALLVWSFSFFLHYFFDHIFFFKEAQNEKNWKTKLSIVGLTLGIVGNICLVFLFFPVTRGSSVLPLLGLTSEASIKYHIWLGHITMFLFTAHGLCYIVYWGLTHRLSKMLEWDKTQVSNLAGEISLLSGLVLWVTTFPRIRRKMFELFFYTHHLYIFFIIFFVFHLGIAYFGYMLPGFYLFMTDRFLRFLQSRRCAQLVSARILPCDNTVELNFSKTKGLSYTPTSIMFINVPSISKLQWHPYTISSSSNLEPGILSVIVKIEGSWTQKLYEKLSSPSPIEHLNVSVEGPYGPASTHFLRHDKLVMVSGGSGIAPFISIIRDLIFMNTTMKCKTPCILLISAFKKSSELTMLNLLLPSSNASYGILNLDLQVEAYVTREIDTPTENPAPLKTIWFKASSDDAPISATLGKHSWLWLGLITSSSFIIYLVTMGLLTRFYIYPKDHNSYKVFASSLRDVLNMILICASILVTATAVFLWNKKQSYKETKQIRGVQSPSIHNSLADNSVERELESLPQQSLIKATKVHYSQRPNLRKILMEQEGSSVGVLVCGPKSMRHDVANICSSGSAKNLHFESISFSW